MAEQPDVIGRYEVESRIAHGGQGTLYKAYDRRLQRHVAIKLLREPDDEDLRRRFARESRAVASLNHPNIVTVFEVGDYDGQPFMAMEYIDGQTLTSIIDTYPLPSTVRRLDLMEALCNGLAFAHKLDVIHRDIKPANLMVRADGRLKIVDFGIARAAADPNLTQAGRLVGTVNYMSPEQVRGADLDGRSDMFAVGAVFYELMCGRQAFPGPTPTVVLPKILDDEPEPLERICPGLDPGISRIILRALEKDPARRFVDLLEMGEEIANVRESIDEAGASVIVAPLDVDTVPPARRRGTDLGEIAQRRTQQIDASLKRAQEALAAGQHDEAIAQCEEVLVLDPANSLAHAVADRARLERDETRARECLSRAGDELRKGELTAAAQSVRDALTLLPDAPDALELARVIREARVAREREAQHDEEARKTAEMAQRLFDEGDHAEALAVLEAFSPAHPILSRLWVSLSARRAAGIAVAVPAGVEPGGGAGPLAAPGAVDRATEPARAPAGRSRRLAAVAMIALAAGLGAFWVWRAGTSGGATPAAPEVPIVPIARADERAGTGIDTAAAQSPAAPRDPRLGREAGPARTPSAPVSPAPDRAAVTAGGGGAPADPNATNALPLPLPSTTGPSSGATGTIVLPVASSPVEAKAPSGGDREARRDDSRAPKAEVSNVEPLVPEKTAAVAPQVAPAVAARAAPAPPGTDEDRIRRALTAYTQALGARDVNGVLHVFPNANRADVTKAFVDVLEFTTEIDVLQVRVAGNAATVIARVRQSIRKVRDQRRSTESQLEYQMQRAGDAWIISAVRSR